MKKKAVETVENKKHISHRFHSTAATTATVIYFLKMCNLRVTILMKTFLSLVKESNGFFKRICRKLLTQLGASIDASHMQNKLRNESVKVSI